MIHSSKSVLVLARCLARYAIMRDQLGRWLDGGLLALHSVGLYAIIVNGVTRGIWRSQADGCASYTLGAIGLLYCITRRLVLLTRIHATKNGPLARPRRHRPVGICE
jgi:hypothetical protein